MLVHFPLSVLSPLGTTCIVRKSGSWSWKWLDDGEGEENKLGMLLALYIAY